jgi:uncharacterized protein with GYD domain
MKKVTTFTAVLVFMILCIGPTSIALAAENDTRTFIFIGEPNAKAWQYLIDNPEDRKKEVTSGMAAIGGEVVGYYFGLGDGKNYIIVELPNDNELIQAVYLMRLPAGLLNSYQIIELMPSDQMSLALKKAQQLIRQDTTVGN